MAVEEKSMVPTVFVGVGGTGAEVLSRVRRLIVETYGSLDKLPIVSFLVVDTDRDYKITNTEAQGPAFRENERHWAKVTGREVQEIVSNMERYPWINAWFPTELEKNITSLEAGAGQIRACGRFAFFCNYHDIQRKFGEACSRMRGKENLMLDRYGVRVVNNAINVFITGSISGGTGSGMMLDLGYAIRHWLTGPGTSQITSIVPMPNAFSGIGVEDRVLANGYAALMELSYFSDGRTEYVAQFSAGLNDEVRSSMPPFDFTYLVGTKNGEVDFTLDQIREMIAQNVFLDLTSDFAPHKRSIRDNMKGKWAQSDPEGRGYSKQFMSFGLSSVEIPITQIRASLSNRLAKDLAHWWLNEAAQLPPQMLDLSRSMLKQMRLTDIDMVMDLVQAGDRSYTEEISNWVNSLRERIADENLLQCTLQGFNLFGTEQGKILQFPAFLKQEVDNYRADHLRDLGDTRTHGDYLLKMYSNRDNLIKRGRQRLEEELYSILSNREKGPQFVADFIVQVRQIWTDAAERFRRDQEKVWEPNEKNRQGQYAAALQDITEFKDKAGLTKQAQMEGFCGDALEGLEGSLSAMLQRKTRALGLEVIVRLQEHLTLLESRFVRFSQRLIQLRDFFSERADREADRADALQINGYKLYDRQELNSLYQDLIERMAGASESSKTRYELGMDQLCDQLSIKILQQSSPLWKETRTAQDEMKLFDITEIPQVQEEDWRDIVFEQSGAVVKDAPESSRLKSDLAACDRLFKMFNDQSEIVSNLRIAYQKSKPLLLLSKGVIDTNRQLLEPALNTNVAVIGGRNTSDPAAKKILDHLREFISSPESIKPLGDNEQHRIVFVQEMGGFSLRCVEGMRKLQKSYQDWKGDSIMAKRAILRGESRDLPIPVHMQKEPPFWDIFPEEPAIYRLVVLARALGVLRQEFNQTTKEQVIRYQQMSVMGPENIDIASNWTEVPQVLEVIACRTDRVEIQRQVDQILDAAETDAAKQSLYSQLMGYLKQRAVDLFKAGGEDSREHKSERTIIKDLVIARKLEPETPPVIVPEPVVSTSPEPVQTSPEPKPPEPPNDPTSGMAKLKELAQFYKDGLLTEAEFTEAKKKLLGL